MNFRYRLMQFMSGRYGIDRLFYVIFAVAAVLALINCFIGSVILQTGVYLLDLYAFFRVFSRNIAARSKENRILTSWMDSIPSKIATRRQRRADTTHIYKKCPYCSAILRLPRRKGKHKTVCPKCSKQFAVRVLRDPKY